MVNLIQLMSAKPSLNETLLICNFSPHGGLIVKRKSIKNTKCKRGLRYEVS